MSTSDNPWNIVGFPKPVEGQGAEEAYLYQEDRYLPDNLAGFRVYGAERITVPPPSYLALEEGLRFPETVFYRKDNFDTWKVTQAPYALGQPKVLNMPSTRDVRTLSDGTPLGPLVGDVGAVTVLNGKPMYMYDLPPSKQTALSSSESSRLGEEYKGIAGSHYERTEAAMSRFSKAMEKMTGRKADLPAIEKRYGGAMSARTKPSGAPKPAAAVAKAPEGKMEEKKERVEEKRDESKNMFLEVEEKVAEEELDTARGLMSPPPTNFEGAQLVNPMAWDEKTRNEDLMKRIVGMTIYELHLSNAQALDNLQALDKNYFTFTFPSLSTVLTVDDSTNELIAYNAIRNEVDLSDALLRNNKGRYDYLKPNNLTEYYEKTLASSASIAHKYGYYPEIPKGDYTGTLTTTELLDFSFQRIISPTLKTIMKFTPEAIDPTYIMEQKVNYIDRATLSKCNFALNDFAEALLEDLITARVENHSPDAHIMARSEALIYVQMNKIHSFLVLYPKDFIESAGAIYPVVQSQLVVTTLYPDSYKAYVNDIDAFLNLESDMIEMLTSAQNNPESTAIVNTYLQEVFTPEGYHYYNHALNLFDQNILAAVNYALLYSLIGAFGILHNSRSVEAHTEIYHIIRNQMKQANMIQREALRSKSNANTTNVEASMIPTRNLHQTYAQMESFYNALPTSYKFEREQAQYYNTQSRKLIEGTTSTIMGGIQGAIVGAPGGIGGMLSGALIGAGAGGILNKAIEHGTHMARENVRSEVRYALTQQMMHHYTSNAKEERNALYNLVRSINTPTIRRDFRMSDSFKAGYEAGEDWEKDQHHHLVNFMRETLGISLGGLAEGGYEAGLYAIKQFQSLYSTPDLSTLKAAQPSALVQSFVEKNPNSKISYIISALGSEHSANILNGVVAAANVGSWIAGTGTYIVGGLITAATLINSIPSIIKAGTSTKDSLQYAGKWISDWLNEEKNRKELNARMNTQKQLLLRSKEFEPQFFEENRSSVVQGMTKANRIHEKLGPQQAKIFKILNEHQQTTKSAQLNDLCYNVVKRRLTEALPQVEGLDPKRGGNKDIYASLQTRNIMSDLGIPTTPDDVDGKTNTYYELIYPGVRQFLENTRATTPKMLDDLCEAIINIKLLITVMSTKKKLKEVTPTDKSLSVFDQIQKAGKLKEDSTPVPRGT